jgi:exopolysaccharide biosynthesis predicted pyruvyltransferase EpsI
MYIERVPNRNSPPAVLLRESYREGKTVKKRTIANLSKLPDDVIDNMKRALKGGKTIKNIESAIVVERSRPHGHIAAVLGTLRKIGLDRILGNKEPRVIAIIISMIVSRHC